MKTKVITEPENRRKLENDMTKNMHICSGLSHVQQSTQTGIQWVKVGLWISSSGSGGCSKWPSLNPKPPSRSSALLRTLSVFRGLKSCEPEDPTSEGSSVGLSLYRLGV